MTPIHALLGESRIVAGGMAIGRLRFDRQRHIETLVAAIDHGVAAIDCAPLYDFGECERRVGEALRRRRSTNVRVFSKVGLRWRDTYGKPMFTGTDITGEPVTVRYDCRPRAVRQDVEDSLGRLGVERIDLVHVHALDRTTPIAETMGALDELRQEGKVGAIGLSTDFGPREIRAAHRALGATPLASLLVTYNPLERSCEREVLPLARAHAIGTLAHTCLARGALTGKFGARARDELAEGDLRRVDPLYHPDNLAKVVDALHGVVVPIARSHGMSLSQVMLAWALQHGDLDGVVVGASRPEQARQNAEAGRLSLGVDERTAIARAFAPLRIDSAPGATVWERIERRARRVPGGIQRRWRRLVDELRPAARGA
ncbi:MAG: aldo/keto reductase [Sandaracinaceae bacterium]